jgi:MoaA/NifB/PqqE/SkfB family radical SAM enzyme
MSATSAAPPRPTSAEAMLAREAIANRPKHWVRCVTACNSKCLFCLDADTPRNVYMPEDEVKADLRRGIEELGADKVIISGGEASLHPLFPEFIRYAKEIGYDRVQTVTNGTRLADPDYYKKCRDAGLGEITYSLHGHTAELHDYLTQTPGAFNKLMKGMIRSIRDPKGPIVNIDVCINKQNVGVLDKVIEMAIRAGCTEFDLLHVIPQANAYDNRELMFYDVKDHMETLHKVFRLNRHPRFVVWTNRFPVSYLEGMEDLIQDPHKMLDEVNGRRFMVRNYLDTGRKLDCREPERCTHCFIEPFCTTMDRTQEDHREDRIEVWDAGDAAGISALPLVPETGAMPFGVSMISVDVADMDALAALGLPDGLGVEARVASPGPVPELGRALRLVVDSPAHLDAWVDGPEGPELLVLLTTQTAGWLRENRSRVAAALPRIRLHQPTWEHVKEALELDIRDPVAFFEAMDLPLRVSGLAACQAPGSALTPDIKRVSPTLYDWETGRIDIRPLARKHVGEHYRAKSVRCRECRVDDRCDGVHINMIRDQGLRQCRPLLDGAWADEAVRQLQARHPAPLARVDVGAPLQAPPPSLPGFAMPDGPVTDPLAAVAMKLKKRREERAQARARGEAVPPSNPFGPKQSRSIPESA